MTSCNSDNKVCFGVRNNKRIKNKINYFFLNN